MLELLEQWYSIPSSHAPNSNIHLTKSNPKHQTLTQAKTDKHAANRYWRQRCWAMFSVVFLAYRIIHVSIYSDDGCRSPSHVTSQMWRSFVSNTSASTQAIESKTPQNGGLLLHGWKMLEPAFFALVLFSFCLSKSKWPWLDGYIMMSLHEAILHKICTWRSYSSYGKWWNLHGLGVFVHCLITSHSATFWKAKIMMPCVTTVATSFTRCNHQGFDRAFGDWVQGAFWLPCSVTFFNGGFWFWPLGRAVRMTWRNFVDSWDAETVGEKGGWWWCFFFKNHIKDEAWSLTCGSNANYAICFTIHIHFDWHMYVYCLQHRHIVYMYIYIYAYVR